jgi:hypothetical protein
MVTTKVEDVPAGLKDEIDSISAQGAPGYEPQAWTREGATD